MIIDLSDGKCNNYIFNLLNNPTNKLAILKKTSREDAEVFKIINLKTLNTQKLCSYYDAGRLLIISYDDDQKIHKIYHTIKHVDHKNSSFKNYDSESLDSFDYLSLLNYCLERISADSSDLPEMPKVAKEEIKIKKVRFNYLRKQKLHQKERFLMQMMMQYQEIVKKQIQIFLDSTEENDKRRKESEKEKDKIRDQILYEIRQHAIKKTEIERNELFKLIWSAYSSTPLLKS